MKSRAFEESRFAASAARHALRSILRLFGSAILAAVIAVSLNRLNESDRKVESSNFFRSTRLGSGEFFDAIAPTYDKLNRIISFGLDQSWRRYAAASVRPSLSKISRGGSFRALDVAAGTGDLVRILADEKIYSEVIALDPSREMLKILQRKLGSRVRAYVGEAENLPFSDDSFDSVTVAFGVRNFADRQKGLREMARVLRPSGRIVVLEATVPHGGGMLDMMARTFIRRIMPKLASMLSGSRESYEYLNESMRQFPKPEEFMQLMRNAGLVVESHERLWPFGAGPDMYVAEKMELTE